jgi:hypothetical protein
MPMVVLSLPGLPQILLPLKDLCVPLAVEKIKHQIGMQHVLHIYTKILAYKVLED